MLVEDVVHQHKLFLQADGNVHRHRYGGDDNVAHIHHSDEVANRMCALVERSRSLVQKHVTVVFGRTD